MIFASHPMNSREAETMSAYQCMKSTLPRRSQRFPDGASSCCAGLDKRELARAYPGSPQRTRQPIGADRTRQGRRKPALRPRSRTDVLSQSSCETLRVSNSEANAARHASRRADLSSRYQRQRFLDLAMSVNVFRPSDEAIFVKGESGGAKVGVASVKMV